MLITLAEFSHYFNKIGKAECEAQLKMVKEEVKPFNTALNELVGMARNGQKRLQTAVAAALKESDKRAGEAPGQRDRLQAVQARPWAPRSLSA